MVESREAEASSPTASPPPPRSPRVVSSTAHDKKTRDQPDLSRCHACGALRAGRLRLLLLPSEWRVVLLCPSCLALLRSARLCSYCLADVEGTELPSLDCRRCSARVHLHCVPREHRCLSPAELHRGAFTCVDCDAFARSFNRRGFNTCLEDVVRDASCEAERKALAAARARENAVKKAAAASRAAERARSALGAVLVVRKKEDAVVPDEELALRLHLEMNGSQRILRSRCNKSSEHLPGLKRVRGHEDSRTWGNGSRNAGVCGRVEVCAEDRSFFDSVKAFESDRSSSDLISGRSQERRKEVDEQTIVSVSVNDALSNGDGNSSAVGNSHDRYFKKYSRRKSRSEGMVNRKNYQLVPCWQNYSAEASRASSDVPCRTSMVSVLSSTHLNDLARCQS